MSQKLSLKQSAQLIPWALTGNKLETNFCFVRRADLWLCGLKRMQRMSGLAGCNATKRCPHEGRLWAESTNACLASVQSLWVSLASFRCKCEIHRPAEGGS